MMTTRKPSWQIRLAVSLVLIFVTMISYGQNPTDTLPGDPGALSVYRLQNMSFGAFTGGATGGTVAVSNTGFRSFTGTVLGINSLPFFQAIYEVDAPFGATVSVMNGPNVILTGSNGGSMTLTLGASSPNTPFIVTVNQPARTDVKIGGTLSVGSSVACPPGNYTGNFIVTFNLE